MVIWFWVFRLMYTGDLDTLQAQITNIIKIDQSINELQLTELSSLTGAHLKFIKSPSSETISEFNKRVRSLNNEVQAITANLPSDLNSRYASHFSNIVGYFKRLEIQSLTFGTPNTGAGTDLFVEQCTVINLIRIELQTIQSKILQENIQNKVDMIPAIMKKNFQLLYILFTAVTLLSFIFAYIFAQKLTRKINSISEQLHRASENILETANEEERTFKTQSVSIDKTAKSISELSQSANQVAGNANNAYLQMKNMADRMSDLQQKAQQIDKISTTIEEVTTQINILSLNASIEASRAGEQGKGFSAVATEIRKLAENTRGFTDTIASLTKEIQGSVNTMVNFSNNAVQLVQKISNAISKQTISTEEINQSVTKINTNIKKTAENVRATVESSENLLDLAQQMKALT